MTEKKRSVLMVSYQYAPAADGGAARQAQSLAEALVTTGRRVGVVTARYPGTPWFERINGVDVHRVWAIPKRGIFSATFLPSLARFLALGGRRYDIWHAHQAFYNAGLAVTLSRLAGTRCIVKTAASGPYGDLARLRKARLGGWVRRALRRADAVISLNTELTTELLDAGIARDRIHRIPNGVDCDHFTPPSDAQRSAARTALGVCAGEVVVVFAGRLSEDKGIGYLVDAWKVVEGRAGVACTLVVAGDELEVGRYARPAGEALRSARFVGKVADVRPLLHAADLLVHPSLTEGLSNIVLEAMAAGLPVVGTAIGGLREQVEPGVTGLLVAPRDPEGLGQAILTLAQDPAALVRFGCAGRARAKTHFRLGSVVEAYDRLYNSLGGRG